MLGWARHVSLVQGLEAFCFLRMVATRILLHRYEKISAAHLLSTNRIDPARDPEYRGSTS